MTTQTRRKKNVPLIDCHHWGINFAVDGYTEAQVTGRLNEYGYSQRTVTRVVKSYREQVARG